MSIEVMTQVWKHADVKGGTLLVLLALADFADDKGWSWPSINTLAQRARLSETQTHEVIRSLKAAGLLVVEPRAGTSNRYRVTLEGCGNRRGDNLTPVQVTGGGGVQVGWTGGVRPTAPKPSLNHQRTVRASSAKNEPLPIYAGADDE